MPAYKSRRDRLKQANIKRRVCLSCGKTFTSLSAGNRICGTCAEKHRARGMAGYPHRYAPPQRACRAGRRDSDAI